MPTTMIRLAVTLAFSRWPPSRCQHGLGRRSDVDGVSRWWRPYLRSGRAAPRTDVVEFTTSRDVAYSALGSIEPWALREVI